MAAERGGPLRRAARSGVEAGAEAGIATPGAAGAEAADPAKRSEATGLETWGLEAWRLDVRGADAGVEAGR